MSLSWTEIWAAVAAMCAVGMLFLGGEALRDEFKLSNQSPWRWGDSQRRGDKEATWGSHLVLAPVCLSIALLIIQATLRSL